MKILIEIGSQYKETEVRICTDRKSEETLALRDSLERMLLPRVTVHKDLEVRQIRAAEIVRIYSESKKVFVRTGNETFEVKDRLYMLEELLGEQGFVRISNSEIVNLSEIEKLDMGLVGTIRIFFKNGDETYASRRYVGRIREMLN